MTSRLREAAAGRDQAAGTAEHTLARAVAAGPRALGVEWRVRADVAESVRRHVGDEPGVGGGGEEDHTQEGAAVLCLLQTEEY